MADRVAVRSGSERRRRTVEVLKLRGAGHRRGEFPFVIDAVSGIEIVPFSPIEGDDSGSAERISLGNADLDAICGGGMYRDALMITGATGTGKTLIGLQFMVAGIQAGERALYLSFEESRWQLERNAAAWGILHACAARRSALHWFLAAIRLGIKQGRTEALNNKVRLITRCAYGFHSAKAALALVLLTCGPITLQLPHELHALGIG